MLAQGVGYAVLPESSQQTQGHKALQPARLSAPAASNSLQLTLPASRPSTRRVSETAALLRKMMVRTTRRW
jgi:hypothetical protein